MLLSAKNKALPQLDARLAAAAAYVRPGGVCADIGCDHGKLSIFLAAHGVCKKVIACDIQEKPLARAARNFALHGCDDRIECRLGNGLSVVTAQEVDDVVIAGVSGVTAVQIVQDAPEFHSAKHRFIFVPASKADLLRAWLCANGFVLADETPAEAAGRFYTVICAEFTGVCRTLSPLECAIGRAGEKQTKAARGYLEKVQGQLQKQGDYALAQAVEEVKRQWEL